MSYEVLVLRRAQRQLARLPSRDYQRTRDLILALGETPRPYGCLKLTNRPGWRIRDGDYRVIYEIDDNLQNITVMDIGHRRDIYS